MHCSVAVCSTIAVCRTGMAFLQCTDELKKCIHDPQTLVLLYHLISEGAQELPDG